jgi:hypothetical protein
MKHWIARDLYRFPQLRLVPAVETTQIGLFRRLKLAIWALFRRPVAHEPRLLDARTPVERRIEDWGTPS